MTATPLLELGRGGRRIHLLGIGGAGMSAIARVLAALGHQVSGSDASASATLDGLAAMGIRVHVGHRPEQLGDAEIVGVSTAIRPDNPELVEAGRRGLAVHHRHDLLAGIGALRSTLSVSGTHGKTTTSALLALVLEAAGVEPSFIIGGVVAPFDSGSRWTDGEWLVLEGDESDSTFLAPPRRGCIVTNVEADHLDHHGTFDALVEAFGRFIGETDGPAVVCGDDPNAARVAAPFPNAITYGRGPGVDAVISDVNAERHGSSWTLRWRDGTQRLTIPRPGDHLVLNATAAVVLGAAIGLDLADAARGIAAYAGVGRRYEMRGRRAGVELIDDYAHLPTEVRAALDAARQSGPTRLVAVFQPHRYSRTAEHHAAYATAFELADVVVITEIYPAGEEPIPGVTGGLVVDAIESGDPGREVHWAPTRADLLSVLDGLLVEGDLCLTMGAGDLTTLPDELLAVLDRRTGGDGGC